MKVRASLKKRTPECKKNNLVYGYKNSWCRFTSKQER